MLALLCSGQGGQHPEMFRLTADHPAAASIFSAARDALGQDPRALVSDGRDSVLYVNRTAQILCVTQALAAAAILAETLASPCLVAGYSVGELAAWGVAGALALHAVPVLAAQRAELMDGAGQADDGLAFVRGLSEQQVERLCSTTGVALAIVNPNLVFVVGGRGDALIRFIAAAREAGAAKAERLDVHTASHTPCLAGAVDPFIDALKAGALQRPKPGFTLLSALDGNRIIHPALEAEGLAQQLATTLRWDQCLEAVFEYGATAVLELGPGRAIADMVTALRPYIPSRSVDDFRTVDGLREWIGAHH